MAMTTPHRFARRTFLRGAGVTLALPLLDAMTPPRALAAASKPPRRMICINTSLGLHTPNLFPTQGGRDYELTPCNLYVQFLRRLGADVNAFGSSSGTIPGFELA